MSATGAVGKVEWKLPSKSEKWLRMQRQISSRARASTLATARLCAGVPGYDAVLGDGAVLGSCSTRRSSAAARSTQSGWRRCIAKVASAKQIRCISMGTHRQRRTRASMMTIASVWSSGTPSSPNVARRSRAYSLSEIG